MALVEVYCLIKKRVVRMDKKLADAFVKMKRASYDLVEPVKTVKPAQARRSYQTKVVIPEARDLIAETPVSHIVPDAVEPDYSQEQVVAEVVDVESEQVETEVAEVVDEPTPKKRGRRKKDADSDTE